jgi:protein ImuB
MRLAHRAGPTVARGDAEPSWDARGTEAMRDAAWVFLEVGDLGRLFPRETGLAAALDVATRKVGLCVRVGIASSKSVARIAAMCSEDGAATLVPSEGARAFLAGVPVSAAGISPEVLLSLTRFGLRTLGAVAALPADGVGRRLGREGAALWRLARGEDDAPLVATLEPEVFAERVELDYALDSTEPLSFLFSGALSRLCARLDARGLACAGLEVTLTLAPRGSHARDVAVAAPTLEASVLTTLVRLSLERAPPPEPVCGFEVVARVAVAAPSQAGLFDPVLPAPAKLAAVVARLCALCGDDRVGAPVVVDSLRPEAAAMGGFSPGTFGAHAPAKRGPSASDAPAVPKRLLALRRLDPPRAADVRCTEGRPIRVDGERLAHVSGPWRLGGEWWTSDPFVRDDYDVETTSGVLLRVYHTPSGAWWVSGIYD